VTHSTSPIPNSPFAIPHLLRSIRLTIAYDGTNFAGWQWQTAQRTVQETLETVLRKLTGEPIRAVASGRTDSGVHALAQVVNFQTASAIPVERFPRAINSELPDDVIVLSACEMPLGFHAIRDAVSKRYRYVLDDGPQPDVFRRSYCWHYRYSLDVESMHAAAQSWLGTHDFHSYQTHGSPRVSTIRTVLDVSVCRPEKLAPELIHFEVEADGFLYNMVRVMVGTLVEVGRGARPVTWPAEALAATDRRAAGITAPPHGLFLVRVHYEDTADEPADLNNAASGG
jgi:tRNA pseudouridine38-40 synthase